MQPDERAAAKAVVWDWLRYPDHAETFHTHAAMEWVQRRPLAEVSRLFDALDSRDARIAELEGVAGQMMAALNADGRHSGSQFKSTCPTCVAIERARALLSRESANAP